MGCRLFGLPDFEANVPGFDSDNQSGGDHAGKVETSLLWSLEPGCVDVSRMPSLPLRPEDATAPGIYFAMGRDAHLADRRTGDRMVADEVRALTDKGAELLAEFEGVPAPSPDRRLRSFESVERFWDAVVRPVLPTFHSMEGYVEATAEVDAIPSSSVWSINSRGPARS